MLVEGEEIVTRNIYLEGRDLGLVDPRREETCSISNRKRKKEREGKKKRERVPDLLFRVF